MRSFPIRPPEGGTPTTRLGLRVRARFDHPRPTRRQAVQAGAVGLLGLGLGELGELRAAGPRQRPANSVIYIFLSGGLAQHESFDPKPDAPADIRGEFKPIATRTPGLFICEHSSIFGAPTRAAAGRDGMTAVTRPPSASPCHARHGNPSIAAKIQCIWA